MTKNLIIWNKKWETGIKKIDEQHKKLVELINKTEALNESGRDGEKLKRLLNDAVEFARVHFSTEEEYFEETGYPDTEMHKEKHAELLIKVLEFNDAFEEGENSPKIIGKFLNFLKAWLDNHLIKVDHKYVPWLTEHGIR